MKIKFISAIQHNGNPIPKDKILETHTRFVAKDIAVQVAEAFIAKGVAIELKEEVKTDVKSTNSKPAKN